MNIFKAVSDGLSMVGTAMISVFNPSVLEGEISSKLKDSDKKIDLFKVDSRGVPVDLDMPKDVIDELYHYFKEQDVKLSVEDWWCLQDDYKANGCIYIY